MFDELLEQVMATRGMTARELLQELFYSVEGVDVSGGKDAVETFLSAKEAVRAYLAQPVAQEPREPTSMDYGNYIEEYAAPAAQAEPRDVPLIPGDWPLIELGYGRIEVAEGHHEGKPALIFGRNGTGKIGEPTQPERAHLPGETLAVITFANIESLDVVARKLAVIRARTFAAPAAQEGTADRQLEPRPDASLRDGRDLDALEHKAARERRYDLRTPVIRQIYDVMQVIEACGASEKLTDAVIKAGALMEPVRVLLEERDALRARAERAEADAARYRWLRDHGEDADLLVYQVRYEHDEGYDHSLLPDELDAAIDRARTQGGNDARIG